MRHWTLKPCTLTWVQWVKEAMTSCIGMDDYRTKTLTIIPYHNCSRQTWIGAWNNLIHQSCVNSCDHVCCLVMKRNSFQLFSIHVLCFLNWTIIHMLFLFLDCSNTSPLFVIRHRQHGSRVLVPMTGGAEPGSTMQQVAEAGRATLWCQVTTSTHVLHDLTFLSGRLKINLTVMPCLPAVAGESFRPVLHSLCSVSPVTTTGRTPAHHCKVRGETSEGQRRQDYSL